MTIIDQLIADERTMKNLKMKSEKNKLDVIRSLGRTL